MPLGFAADGPIYRHSALDSQPGHNVGGDSLYKRRLCFTKGIHTGT